MNLSTAWAGQDLDVAETDSFPFGGERILVDHDLGDRLLVRQCWTSGKAVDEHAGATLAFQTSPSHLVPLSEAIGKHPYLRLLTIALFAMGLCIALTLHITRPLGKLRHAASEIASGRLKTRVKPAIGRRHDEIARLGDDFESNAEPGRRKRPAAH